ncbi:MAG: diguanylate cyclase [Caldibacillus debilis]|uniref:Diguanylate cyclase n=1 Tax=Caldibacillus debilis TaxID=301148 RepID=A0A3E0K8D6_9BACI|nr:dipeptidase [Caldibacillus debilis]OUM86337.1 MAG: diguanylate cyclase [Caldibacillus debilis]REJ30901.1 MAG: diguanylate cyclase [Caldibacillus debilis]
MQVIDLHCDVLLKLSQGKGKLRFRDSKELDVNFERLRKGKVKVQFFAVFLEPEIPAEQKFVEALNQIDYFYEEVLKKNPEMKHIKEWSDIEKLKEGEIGAVLTLEGADAVGDDLMKLRTLYRLGVKLVGLTWNFANYAADGVMEERGGGLTRFGKEVVRLNNEQKVFTDVSHLSERGFWEVMELADYPIASHSNAKSLCNHPRNLTDEQAKALFQKGGMVHVVYNPPFIKESGNASIGDLVRHIDHFCSLGGVKQIGLGSDFDGIEKKVKNLEDASKTQNLILALLKYYKEDEVKGFAYRNFLEHLPK